MTKLQLALDDLDRADLFPLLDQVAAQLDIVEVGTPMVIRYGLEPVRAIKQRHPQLAVLCDAKIMDAAYYEAALAFEAGADCATILALTDDGSVTGAVQAAADHGGRIMADLICVPDLVARARRLQELGVHVVAVHTGVDQQALGRTPLDDLRALAESDLVVPLAVAGGVTSETAGDYLALKPDILIVGGGITGAPDPAAEAVRLRQLIEGANP